MHCPWTASVAFRGSGAGHRYHSIVLLCTGYVSNIDRVLGQYRTQYMSERCSCEGMYRVRYCPRVRSITHLLHARLGYQHFFPFFVVVLGVKVRSISCNIGSAERAISRNMDRPRMSGIGQLHDDGHVPCNKVWYCPQYEVNIFIACSLHRVLFMGAYGGMV